MTRVEVTRTYLELKDPDRFRPARLDDDPLIRIARVPVPSVELAQRLYREVGSEYHWVDRWSWSAQEWEAWVRRPGYGLWIMSYDGDVAGFFELKWSDAGDVEIELIGLVKRFHGRGLGGHLLTSAVEIAFAIGASRIWLHTCTLDHPAALPNYQARGFTPFRTEKYFVER